jgi:hypothetical protein
MPKQYNVRPIKHSFEESNTKVLFSVLLQLHQRILVYCERVIFHLYHCMSKFRFGYGDIVLLT